MGQALEGEEHCFSSSHTTQFGFAVSLSPDGFTLAVGAPNWNEKGRVYIYLFNKGSNYWYRKGDHDIDGQSLPWDSCKNLPCTQPSELFGQSLAMNAEGTVAVVGVPHDYHDNGYRAGSARVYQLDTSSMAWVQIGSDIQGKFEWDLAGYGVDISWDGNIVAVGSRYGGPFPGYSTQDTGQVRAFQFNGIDWVQMGSTIEGPFDPLCSGHRSLYLLMV